MAKTNVMLGVLLIVFSGCNPSRTSVKDSRTLSTVQQIFPDATGLRDVSIPQNTQQFGHADQIVVEAIVFPDATGLRDVSTPQDTQRFGHADQIVVKAIKNQTGSLGYCVESTVAGKSGPFRIRVLVDSNLYVRQASVVSYTWDRGRDVRKLKFTRQFEGKGPNDSIQIGQDIDAMTGATLSSKAMAHGVRDTIMLLGTMQ